MPVRVEGDQQVRTKDRLDQIEKVLFPKEQVFPYRERRRTTVLPVRDDATEQSSALDWAIRTVKKYRIGGVSTIESDAVLEKIIEDLHKGIES